MRRFPLMVALLLPLASCAPVGATYLGFSVGTTYAPPPPHLFLERRPEMVVVPGSEVYVVSDPSVDVDLFRYGSSWYACSDGYWYRARSYDGPYVAVDVRSVPREVVTVPEGHWKHHPHGGPPGQMKKGHGWRS